MLGSRSAGDPNEQDHITRQLRIVEITESLLTETDPMLMADSTIQQISQHFQQARKYLQDWVNNGSLSSLTSSTPQFDSLLTTLAQIPRASHTSHTTSEISTLRRSVGQHRSIVDRQIVELKELSSNARSEFEGKVTQADHKVNDLQSDLDRLKSEIAESRTAAREQVNQQQNTFHSSQEQRNEAFNNFLNDKRSDAEAAIQVMEAQTTEQTNSITSTLSERLDEAETSKNKIEHILNIVGEEALVGTYSKNAALERSRADQWRWFAILFALASVAIGSWLVVSAADVGSDWDLLAAKALLAAPLATVATYSARQSFEHRHVQREAEHLALQLAALGPYLNDIRNIDARDQLLIGTAGKIFGNPRTKVERGSKKGISPTPPME